MLLRGTSRDVRELRETVSRINELGQIRGGFLDPDVQGKIEVLYAQITSTTQTSGRYPASLYTADSQATTWTDASDTCWLVPPNGEALSTGTVYAVNLREVLDSDGLAVYTVMGTVSGGIRTGWAPVRVYTTSLPSYTRSTNTITATANGALAAQDGVTLVAGDRLLHNRSSGHADNGIWTVTQVGTGGTPYILDRASDADLSADYKSGYTVAVSEGTTNKDTLWMLTTNDTITLNTTAIVFAQIAPSGASPLTTKGDIWGFSTVDARLPVGTNGQYLTADSAETLGIKWVTISAITSLNALTGATQTFAVGTTGTDFNIASSGTTHTFHMPDAGATQRGVVTTGSQIMAGAKNFTSTVTVGTSGGTFTDYASAYLLGQTGSGTYIKLDFSPANKGVVLYAESGSVQQNACYGVYDSSSGPFLGKTGTFTTTDGKTVTVKGGIITNIV